MNDDEKTSKYYNNLNSLFDKINGLLGNYEKSPILQDYFYVQFRSFVYANLIDNFFKNMNQENIDELKLPQNKISLLNKEYDSLKKDVGSVLVFSSEKKLDEKTYLDFKSSLKSKFPDFLRLISEIEKIASIKDLPEYLDKKRKEMQNSGKDDPKLETTILTKSLEGYLSKYGKLPSGPDFGKSLKSIAMESLNSTSEIVMKNLDKDRPRMLLEHKGIRKGFENRLYKTWNEPFDLLESLIVVCLECGENKKNKLSGGKNIVNPKQVALIRVHVRSIQIAYEVLALVRSGFADGAHARWRSLHELGIITFFLRENNDDVSERYLNHNVMKKFKASKSYQKHHKALKYPSMTKREIEVLEKEHSRLLQKYGTEFEYCNGFEWIPKSILKNRNFKSLEEYVKLDKFDPFYGWASDAVHGGSKGLDRLGLMNDLKDQVLAAGATNYGFADPIDSTAISLSHTTVNLLLLEPDFEDLIMMNVIQRHIKDIGEKALKVQKKLEKEHKNKVNSV